MAYTSIDDPTLYFNTKLYTGNGSTNAITGVGFQPDWVWTKGRNDTYSHMLYDSVRGATKELNSHLTDAETTVTNSLTSFDSDGFSLGSFGESNDTSQAFVSWNWKAGGTASSNTDGSITSSVSASTTSGFSIVSYTGTGSNATVGHGLGAVPQTVIVKRRSSSESWMSYHEPLGNTGRLGFNFSDGVANSSTYWNSTTPTSSVFSIGTNGSTNASSETYIAYGFAEKKGFSKFGSYTGNGSTDGTFVYTGFKPAFVIRKVTSASSDWLMQDNKRSESGGFNQIRNYLFPNSSQAEVSNQDYFNIDFLSNGFKMRSTDGGANGSGQSYIYMAFAENPFVTSTGIPTCAR